MKEFIIEEKLAKVCWFDRNFYEYSSFKFSGSENFKLNEIPLCSICKNLFIHPIYSIIIKKLKKAGLLPKNYKPRCCVCVAQEKGLLPEEI